jgi:NADH dehydrogenase (ubiquinone) flavoprotein 2
MSFLCLALKAELTYL